MEIRTTDYNGAAALIDGGFARQWTEFAQVLSAMPLHLKASDQKGIVGRAIFDPVGTNAYFKARLERLGWTANSPIPEIFRFLGTGVDFENNGILTEIQFSNYPFLLNNLIRSELFFKSKTAFSGHRTQLVYIVTKEGPLPASNSTLYYEQAERQLSAMERFHLFTVPIRLVGLFATPGEQVEIIWTTYTNNRYSRTVQERSTKTCSIGRVGARYAIQIR